MIDVIKGFITGDSGIVVIILGLIITFATKRISKAIKGTALEGDLKDLLETTANAALDGKLTGKEARAIGKAGLDSGKSLKEFLANKGD